MADYEPLDLAALCNAGLSVLGEQVPAPVGAQVFRGLPFLIGSPAGDGRTCLLAFGAGLCEVPLTIPIGRAARRVIVAHRLLESDIEQGGAIGKSVAEYVFHLGDGSAVSVPIRERFEISSIPESIWLVPVLPALVQR